MGRAVIIHHGSAAARGAGNRPGIASEAPAVLGLMPGEEAWYRWHGERVHYRVLGQGEPVVLVHAPDVGACCLEWRNNVETLAEHYAVHAIDLPGFGLSDVHAGPYTAEIYTRFLADFLKDVIGRPARAIGSVLGASYLAVVAEHHPRLLDRLILIAPAGLSARRPKPLSPVTFRLLGLPGLSGAMQNSATSRFAIVEHLHHDVYLEPANAGSQAIDARHWICHRPNAEYVERSRMAGLMNVDIRAAVPRLLQRLLVVWGRHAENPPVTDLETFCELNLDAKSAVFDRSALAPHEEEPGRFNALAVEFMGM